MREKILDWLLEGLFFGIGLGGAAIVGLAVLVPVIVFASFVSDERRRRKGWKVRAGSPPSPPPPPPRRPRPDGDS